MPAKLGCPVRRIPKGVDSVLFTPEGDSHRAGLGLQGKRVVLAVGRLVPIKNMRLLIDAWPAVLATVPEAHLVIVGEGAERAGLESVAAAAGVAGAVTFGGYVAQADTPSWYRAADVFALSSDFDNSPNVVLEAMASGLPVVSTDVGGVAGFVGPESGRLVPARDAAAMAGALTSLLQDSATCRRMGETNRRLAEERFSWRASARALLDVYEDVVRNRARRQKVPA